MVEWPVRATAAWWLTVSARPMHSAMSLAVRWGSRPGERLRLAGVHEDLEAVGSTHDGSVVEEIRDRVGGRLALSRDRAGGHLHDAPNGELVEDDEHDALRACEYAPQPGRVAQQRSVDALALREALPGSVVLPPLPVVLDRRAVEVAELQLGEARLDQPRHVPASPRDVDGLARPQEPRRHREVHVETGELHAQSPRL